MNDNIAQLLMSGDKSNILLMAELFTNLSPIEIWDSLQYIMDILIKDRNTLEFNTFYKKFDSYFWASYTSNLFVVGYLGVTIKPPNMEITLCNFNRTEIFSSPTQHFKDLIILILKKS